MMTNIKTHDDDMKATCKIHDDTMKVTCKIHDDRIWYDYDIMRYDGYILWYVMICNDDDKHKNPWWRHEGNM